jgi:Ca2+-transporting ATPase
MLLVFQNLPLSEGLARSRPRRSASFFRRRDWVLIAIVGGLITLLVVVGYVRSLGAGRDVEHARAMALAALTVSSAMLTVYLSRLRTGMSRLIAGCTIASSLLLIQVPPLAMLLHLQPLHWDDWATAVAGSLAAVMAPLLLSSLISSARSSS